LLSTLRPSLAHVSLSVSVFIADQDSEGAASLARQINSAGKARADSATVDVTDWNQQSKVFERAVTAFGRIDYVYPIAGVGERRWLNNDPNSTGWEPPDLTVLDVDLKGVLYTCSLAIQHFRRQEPNEHGLRGKIFCAASVCGFYAIPTLPIYTAAKHGVIGFVRTYGTYLAKEEAITINAICPNVVRTHISTPAFYQKLEDKDLLTPVERVIEAFEGLLGEDKRSGLCFEIGPKSTRVKEFESEMDDASKELNALLLERARPLQTVSQ
jgi:NAD(P)-dependent dehydrogenase (short-subunit alcohol dehydrogenase family)